ncbi:uncharacterized protein LOC121499940 [Vulpes lagopus]|uniref:uncharacterized protein LOC121499940 n=1 Tax=Vulpes lagopus TaxID=494514 RepID=UPI001BCA23BB|nr:uncharacterized protein LOC121499940 [Vulpes lagopus]
MEAPPQRGRVDSSLASQVASRTGGCVRPHCLWAIPSPVSFEACVEQEVVMVVGGEENQVGPPGGGGSLLSIYLQPTDKLCAEVQDLEGLHLARITSLVTVKDEQILDLVKDPQDSPIPGPPPTPKQMPVCNETSFGHQTFPLKGTGFKSVHCQGQGAENMDIEKFQQKALKQTKQKKSKSAEFLMVKEDREVMEGIGNPAFNMSSPDLLAHQTSDKSVIRHDMPDHTLAAHQQKFGPLASAEPKGNEYSRNYFDPLMDEEINPRQCGMEVSREDESFKEMDSEEAVGSRKRPELHKEGSKATPAYSEASERYVQRRVILLGNSSSEQIKCNNILILIDISEVLIRMYIPGNKTIPTISESLDFEP